MSPSPIRMRWSRLAIRDSAAIGSPCEPVEISTTCVVGQVVELVDVDHQPGGT